MEVTPFRIEKYYERYEFTTRYMLHDPLHAVEQRLRVADRR
ncbi:MAG: hypothetical protein ABSE47_02830 [Acidimicrobiales bacterium]